MTLDELLADRRVCVCAGPGGVGKTTSSAALALGMARRGRRVAVVTIDPARRLARALGLRELDNEPRRVELAEPVAGELWAMMLDPKRTFDELIERVAPSPQRAEEIKGNRVYREISGAVSGSQEFTAVAKLYDLAQSDRFDLLVLDTPPSRNALDFLEAPGRLLSFLEGSAIRTLIRPTGLGMRVLGRGASPLLGVLRRVTGLDLLGDLSTFFGLLGGMTDDFSRRAAEVERMLRAPDTAFLLVTSAAAATVDEAIWLHRSLITSGLPFAGTIVNRVHAAGLDDDTDLDTLAAALRDRIGGPLTAGVLEAVADEHRLAARDRHQLQRLADELGDGTPLIAVPELGDDVVDIPGLERVRAHLFAAG